MSLHYNYSASDCRYIKAIASYCLVCNCPSVSHGRYAVIGKRRSKYKVSCKDCKFYVSFNQLEFI